MRARNLILKFNSCEEYWFKIRARHAIHNRQTQFFFFFLIFFCIVFIFNKVICFIQEKSIMIVECVRSSNKKNVNEKWVLLWMFSCRLGYEFFDILFFLFIIFSRNIAFDLIRFRSNAKLCNYLSIELWKLLANLLQRKKNEWPKCKWPRDLERLLLTRYLNADFEERKSIESLSKQFYMEVCT